MLLHLTTHKAPVVSSALDRSVLLRRDDGGERFGHQSPRNLHLRAQRNKNIDDDASSSAAATMVTLTGGGGGGATTTITKRTSTKP